MLQVKQQLASAATASALILMGMTQNVHAASYEVSADVLAQGYEVISPWGDRILGKRRLGAQLGLAGYHLQGQSDPSGADYTIVLRLRFDADFGIAGDERRYTANETSRFVPGQPSTPVELMFGYVEGKRLWGAPLGFRIGRQYQNDVLGWWSFDGAEINVSTPWFFRAELYGGFEQRGGMPLSTSRFEAQGVWRGSHAGDGFRSAAHDYPSYQFFGPAPAFGAAIETDGPPWIHGRLSYRRVYQLGAAFTGQFPASDGGGFSTIEGQRLSSERVGYAASVFLAEWGSARGGFSYDLYNQLVNKVYGSLEAYPIAKRLTVGADLDFFVPTFDADSIFNWFAHNPSIGLTGRVSTRPTDAWSVSGSGGVKLWMTDGDPSTWAADECAAFSSSIALDECLRFGIDPSFGAEGNGSAQAGTPLEGREALAGFARSDDARETTIAPDVVANLGTRYLWGSGEASANGMLQMGVGHKDAARATRFGGGVFAKQAVGSQQFWLGGRVSLYRWEDPLRVPLGDKQPNRSRDATSFGYVLAPEYRPYEQARFRVEWEHNINRLVGQRFRVIAVANVRFDP